MFMETLVGQQMEDKGIPITKTLLFPLPGDPRNPAEPVLFYAPLVGIPFTHTDPTQAETVAFGSIRPWIST